MCRGVAPRRSVSSVRTNLGLPLGIMIEKLSISNALADHKSSAFRDVSSYMFCISQQRVYMLQCSYIEGNSLTT